VVGNIKKWLRLWLRSLFKVDQILVSAVLGLVRTISYFLILDKFKKCIKIRMNEFPRKSGF